MDKLFEQLLLEKTRRQLIAKSQSADKVKAYNGTRWEGRNRVKQFDTPENYNRIDFNSLFKADLMNIILPIEGETDNYSVEVLFEGICSKIRDELKRNYFKLEYKVIYRAIINAVNAGDVLVSCTCPDWKYRQAYQGTKGQYNAGIPELRPAPITNPNDTKGAGCKHVMNVLGDLSWGMKLAVCITNYIFYISDNRPDLFEQIIWPAISGMTYEEGKQQGLFGDLANTVDDSKGLEEIQKANDEYYVDDSDMEEEPEDFDKPESEQKTPNKVGRASLEQYYIKENHTREETQQRFHLTEDELRDLLDEYDLRKRDVD